MELLYVSDDKYFMYESNTPLMIKKAPSLQAPFTSQNISSVIRHIESLDVCMEH
jgi:hypothetical protein